MTKWVDIMGYEGKYQINDLGEIRSVARMDSLNRYTLKSIIRKPDIDIHGYLKIGLRKNGKQHRHTVHRLVAVNFIPNPKNKSTINHINGIKIDNRVQNLEWATMREQSQHAVKLGLRSYEGEDHPNAKLTNLNVIAIKKLLDQKKTLKEIAKQFGMSWAMIGHIKTGKSWSHIK